MICRFFLNRNIHDAFFNAIGIKKIESLLFFLLLFTIPTQLGKHYWLTSLLVVGRNIDYLSPTIYLTDVVWFFWSAFFAYINHKLIFQSIVNNKIKTITIFLTGIVLILIAKNQITAFFYTLRILEIIVFGWFAVLKKPVKQNLIYPLAIGVGASVFLENAQFFLQSSIGGWLYYLGERSINLNTPAIAHLVVNGKLFLRPYAFFPHPNVLAGYLLVLWPMWYFWQINSGSKTQYLLRQILLIFSLLGIFLTFSRVAWLGSILMLVFVSKKNIKEMKLFLLILTALILEEIFIGRFVNIYQDVQPVAQRNQLITNALDIFSQSPIIGVGLGNFLLQLPREQKPPYLFQPAHNFWLMVLTETGILGFLFVLIFFVKTLQKTLNDKKYYLFVSLLLFLWLSWFDHYFYDIKQTQWILGLLISLVWI